MPDNARKFEAGPDPFGRRWQVEFRWHQTAIAIRHADAVDTRWRLTCGEEAVDKVIALNHPDLLRLAKAAGRPLTDAWVMKLAACHLRHMVDTFEDFEKPLVTVSSTQLESYLPRV